jgi:hypothetical protein
MACQLQVGDLAAAFTLAAIRVAPVVLPAFSFALVDAG